MEWNSLKTKLHVEPAVLSEDDVRSATTYLPMLHKQALIEQLTNGCIEKVEVKPNDFQPIPPRYQEDGFAKSLICRAVLVSFYLNLYELPGLFKDKPEFEFSMHDYDRFATIPMQLKQMGKSEDAEISQRATAILTDYAEFEQQLNLSVSNYIRSHNDVCLRVVQMMNMQSSPESIQNALAELRRIQGEIENGAKKAEEAKVSAEETNNSEDAGKAGG